MNGRIYDPLLGRFLSADIMVDGPGDLQGYNRYSYVKNRPLSMIDPSGWGSEMAVMGIGGPGMGFYTKGNNVNIAFTAQKAGFDAAHEVGKSEFTENLRTEAKAGVDAAGIILAPVIAAEAAPATILGAAATDFSIFGAIGGLRQMAHNAIDGQPLMQNVASTAVKDGVWAATGGALFRSLGRLFHAAPTTGSAPEVAPEAPSTIQQNAQQGKAFQKTVSDRVKDVDPIVAEEITIKVKSGDKTRVDIASKSEDGQINLTEAKSSATASLTDKQKISFPQIEESGGVVVGKGKPGFEGGTVIPPTKVKIVRPEDLEDGS